MAILIPTGGVVAKLGTADHQLIACRHAVDVDATLADGDFAVLGVLPAGHILVDAFVDVDDLDTDETPAVVFDGGALDDGTTPTEIVSTKKIMSALTTAQAGGIGRADEKVVARMPVVKTDTYFGIEITTTADAAATTGTIGMTLLYRKASPAVYVSDKAWSGTPAVTSAKAGAVVAVRGEIDVLTTLKATDVLNFLKVPPGAQLVDVFVDSDDLDQHGTPALVLDFGYLDLTGLLIATVLINDSTVGQAGGVARAVLASVMDAAKLTAEKTLAAYVVTQAAHPKAGTIGVTAYYRMP